LTNMAAHILTNKKKLTLCKHWFRVTHNRNGEPDIPRDKVSPKKKMPNILFIGNCETYSIRFLWQKLLTGIIFEHYNFQNTLKSTKTMIMYKIRYIYLHIQNTEVLFESSLLPISAMLYYILALFGNWIDFKFKSSLIGCVIKINNTGKGQCNFPYYRKQNI
jgi:hypothetical protein